MATVLKESESAKIRRKLSHPVVDGDGHWLEPMPTFLDYLREVGGSDLRDDFLRHFHERSGRWYQASPEERMSQRITRLAWWGFPGSAIDRATGMIPKLMYERLDDF